VTVVGAAEFGLPEPEETATTFVGNARLKAHAAARASGLVALADDSGLAVDALGGAPGVFTADWATTACGRDFAVGMERVWRELEAIQAPEPRLAQFCCTLVLAAPNGEDSVLKANRLVVWFGLAVALRDMASTRSSCPMDMIGPSAKWTAGRRIACRTARTPSPSWSRRCFPRWMTGDMPASAFTCTGPSASRNAPTAISTAMITDCP